MRVEGMCFSRRYWEHVLRELPGLRRFACGEAWTTREVTGALGRKCRSLGGELLCPRLEDLDLAWDLPNSVIKTGRERGWRSLQQDSGGQLDIDARPESKSPLRAPLSEFCDILKACLAERTGCCAPVGRLSVALHWDRRRESTVLEGWQVALVEQRLRCALGHLVGDVAVGSEVSF